MADEQNGSPIEFRHDSILRVEHPRDPQASPPKKPRTQNGTSAKRKAIQSEQSSSCSVLRSGNASGIDFALLCITKPIIISGCAWISVLHHGIRIFGHTMHRNDQPVLAVSAPLAPLLLKLSPCYPSTEDKNYLKRAGSKRKERPAAVLHNQIKLSLESDFEVPDSESAVVLISSCPRDEHLWKAADNVPESDDLAFSLNPTLQHLSLPNFSNFTPVVPSLRISLSTENIATFEEWANWDSFLHDIDAFLAEHPSSDLRVLVSGAGGSGKSTFVRCISNYLATVCGRLVLIDTDVGQPELNLPGLVAAHDISELHIGSAIAHVRGVPVAARLLGETTPRDDPDLYEACIAEVSEAGLAHGMQRGLPVVINTDGWISGAGSEFLNNVIAQTKPTHAICMFAGKGQSTGLRPSFRTNNSELYTFYIQRPLNEGRPLYTRSVARELQICSYFCKELSVGRVRAVAMDHLPVILRGERIDSVARALLIMNGSIVAMATSSVRSKSQLAEANIIGYGLVRGVLVGNNMAYISSPLPTRVLKQSVALIVCEHIHIPNAMILSAVSAMPEDVESPFILRDHIDVSHHMYSRSSLQRRTTTGAERIQVQTKIP